MMNSIIELCDIVGVCGNEQMIKRYIIDRVKEKYDIKEDNFGNIICSKDINVELPTIVFIANMDEAGFIVSGINDNGIVQYYSMGMLKNEYLSGKRVEFQNEVFGIITDDKNDLEHGIDIGASNYKDACEKISIGDIASFSETGLILGDMIIARNCSPRIGCGVLLEVMEGIKSPKYNLCFAFTAQGMLGNRGISVLSNYLKADCFVSIDYIEVKEFNKNVIIALKDKTMLYDSEIINKLKNEASKSGVECQEKVISSKQGLLYPFKKNSPESKLLSLLYEIKYQGTGNEMASLVYTEKLKRIIDIIIYSDIITVERTSGR